MRRSIRAAVILRGICMALAAGWAGTAAAAQAAATALLLHDHRLDRATGQLSVLVAKGGVR
jgi:hypothetical protein